MEKLHIGLLYGGRSVEHEVSIVSATSILSALDRARYAVSLIGVDPEGRWHRAPAGPPGADDEAALARVLETPVLSPGEILAAADPDARLDVVFPIVHGRGGEDGALQGLLETLDVAYVGSGVLSSALQMDKDFAKQLLARGGLPVTPWLTFRAVDLERDGIPAAAERVETELGFPVYVKPANSGSSVGIDRADDVAALIAAIAVARRYDVKVVVESAVDAQEVEVAVLGNDEPEASVVGEIRAAQSFYDYDAKYRDDSTELLIPAELETELAETIRGAAREAYRVLGAEGLARVDFLVDRRTHRFYVNELNSLPGFTSVSMYPKLWEATGLPYPRLLDRLIELALERHDRRAKLETHPPSARDGATGGADGGAAGGADGGDEG